MFGYAMIALSMLFVTVFTFIPPILASLGLSFFDWDVISPPTWAGLANYQRFFTDGPVLQSFGVTIVMAIAIVALQLSLGLFLAVLVNQRTSNFGRTFFRTAFYLPLLASTAAVAIFMGVPVRREVRGRSTTTSGCSGCRACLVDQLSGRRRRSC